MIKPVCKYDDCESCVFADMDTPICDECEDGDQWEPADPMECFGFVSSKKIIKVKRTRVKEAA